MKINSTYSPLALLLSLVLLLSLSQCRCKDEKKPCQDPTNINCENYDPCYGKKEVYTHFTVLPGTNGFKEPEWCNPQSCDTINGTSAIFRVPDGNTPNTTYEWRIGTDTTVRTEKAFEISFYSHLQQGNWEAYIPVTLTIKRPLDNCLANPADTLVTGTRNIFFTEHSLMKIYDKDTPIVFQGYLEDAPDKEVVLTYFWLPKFRNHSDSYLVTGYPFADTLLIFSNSCGNLGACGNYREYIVKYIVKSSSEYCITAHLTGYLTELRYYKYNNTKIKITRVCDTPNGLKTIVFIGEKI